MNDRIPVREILGQDHGSYTDWEEVCFTPAKIRKALIRAVTHAVLEVYGDRAVHEDEVEATKKDGSKTFTYDEILDLVLHATSHAYTWHINETGFLGDLPPKERMEWLGNTLHHYAVGAATMLSNLRTNEITRSGRDWSEIK